MPLANNNGVTLSWREGGPEGGAADANPILLVMGHRYSGAMWYPIVPALAATRRVVWFDNRGTGESGYTRHATMQDLAGDALAVMDAAGLERAHIFGVSMGGPVVQAMMLQQPARAVSLIFGCTGILTADKPRAPAAMRLLYYLPPPLLKLLMRPRGGGNGYGGAADPAAVAEDLAMIAKDKHVVAGVVAQAEATANFSITREAVAAMTQPALVLHGDEDALVPFAYGEELAAALPNARFVRLAGAGHNFFVARKAEAIEAVTQFLVEVDGKLAEG